MVIECFEKERYGREQSMHIQKKPTEYIKDCTKAVTLLHKPKFGFSTISVRRTGSLLVFINLHLYLAVIISMAI
jgi:hypothetical protein